MLTHSVTCHSHGSCTCVRAFIYDWVRFGGEWMYGCMAVWVMSLCATHSRKKGQKTQNVQNETSRTTTKLRVCCFFVGVFLVFLFFFTHIEAYTSSSACGCFCWLAGNPFGAVFCCSLFEFPSGMKYIPCFLFVCVAKSCSKNYTCTHLSAHVCVLFQHTQQHQHKNLIWICTSNSHINF